MTVSRTREGEVVAVSKHGETVYIAVEPRGAEEARLAAAGVPAELGGPAGRLTVTALVASDLLQRARDVLQQLASLASPGMTVLALDEEDYEVLGPVAVGDTVKISVSRGEVRVSFTPRQVRA